MDLLGGLTAIQQTLAITKELRSIDEKINVAELKMRIAEMVDSLLDAKQALVDAQEREVQLRNEIALLSEAAKRRAKLRDTDGCLYEIDEAGEKFGEPYCNLCFVREEKLYRLKFIKAYPGMSGVVYMAPDTAHYVCPNCKTRCGG